MKARANSVTVARPDVPARMLNGGISLSAILSAAQLTPQARLTATSMRRARRATSFEEGGGTGQRSQAAKREKASVAPARSARARVSGPQKCRLARTFRHVAPQLAVCYATARFSRDF